LQLCLMFSHLLFIAVIYMHCMFRPNWPSSVYNSFYIVGLYKAILQYQPKEEPAAVTGAL
jgi:hypothetical protein